MNVIIWGATGMVGQGVLRECLRAGDVGTVLAVGRSAPTARHFKLQTLVRRDLLDYGPVAEQLAGYDACFFCLGVSSAGMDETAYTRVTRDLTLAAAETLEKLNPDMTFIYLSGSGADSSGQSRSMWARVRGGTENALLRLAFRHVYILRPGLILPKHGEQSKTPLYRISYRLLSPLLSPLQSLLPGVILTTEVLARAMLNLARLGTGDTILDSRRINDVAALPPP